MPTVVQAVLKDLRIKVASFERCHKDYGTYIDELARDEGALAEAKTKESGSVSQLEQVVQETAAMIPVTASNTVKMAQGLVEFWKTKKSALNDGITSADAADKARLQKEVAQQAKNLERALASDAKKDPLHKEEELTASLRAILKDIREMTSSSE